MGTKDERINLRVDAGQKSLLEAASEVEQTSVSAFVLSARYRSGVERTR